MHITLRQLEIFLAVYDSRSLSKAASKLCVTTSAASQSLKELERILGAELFIRKAGGLVAADAASALLPLATLVVNKSEEIESIFAAREKGLAGKITIGANRACGIYILSRRLPDFKRRHPAVDPSLIIEDNDVVEAAVLENRMDVGFISRPPVDATLTFFPCFRDDFVLIASPKSQYISIEATTEDFCLATWVMDQEETVREAAMRWLLIWAPALLSPGFPIWKISICRCGDLITAQNLISVCFKFFCRQNIRVSHSSGYLFDPVLRKRCIDRAICSACSGACQETHYHKRTFMAIHYDWFSVMSRLFFKPACYRK